MEARIMQSNNSVARLSKPSGGIIHVISGSSSKARIWTRAICGRSSSVASRTVVTGSMYSTLELRSAEPETPGPVRNPDHGPKVATGCGARQNLRNGHQPPHRPYQWHQDARG